VRLSGKMMIPMARNHKLGDICFLLIFSVALVKTVGCRQHDALKNCFCVNFQKCEEKLLFAFDKVDQIGAGNSSDSCFLAWTVSGRLDVEKTYEILVDELSTQIVDQNCKIVSTRRTESSKFLIIFEEQPGIKERSVLVQVKNSNNNVDEKTSEPQYVVEVRVGSKNSSEDSGNENTIQVE